METGRRVQRFPAWEERSSPITAPRLSQFACLPPRAHRFPRPDNPVGSSETSSPSPALSVFFLRAPVDNGWQLPALRTKQTFRPWDKLLKLEFLERAYIQHPQAEARTELALHRRRVTEMAGEWSGGARGGWTLFFKRVEGCHLEP